MYGIIRKCLYFADQVKTEKQQCQILKKGVSELKYIFVDNCHMDPKDFKEGI